MTTPTPTAPTGVLLTAWEPRHDQIIVRPMEAASRTAGGLVLPDQARDKPQQGVVLAVGPDAEARLAEGDVVAYGKFAGIVFDDPAAPVPLLVMREVEAILYRRAGSVALIEHETPAGRRALHEAGTVCEHCPSPELDRLRAEHQEAQRLHLTPASKLNR